MPDPHPNRLLAAIPAKSRKHLLSNSVEVHLATTTILHEARSRPSHAFFITSGLASVLAVTTLGLSAEVGMVGREGFIGSLHLIGPVDTPTHCRMQLAGAAIRIPMEHLQKAFEQDEAIHRRVLEFVQAQTHALSQVAGCHRIHGALRASDPLAPTCTGPYRVFDHRHHAGNSERTAGNKAGHHRCGCR